MRLALVAAALLITACGGEPRVVARDDGGAIVAAAPLPADGHIALTYRHSVYGATAEERFRASAGGFVLESVASPSADVIDYYALDGTRTREGGTWVMTPSHAARFETMALAATERGRRTLVAGARRIPLYGHAVHLRLAVER